MQRKLILAKNASLWEKGDAARSIAILEKGKLAVKAEDKLVGYIWPKMVLGESAILTLDGETPVRTAATIAIEDNTTVVEYPASLVKQVFEMGNTQVISMILKTLVGQVARNCLLVISSNQKSPIIYGPLKEFIRGLVQNAGQLNQHMATWSDFMYLFRYLCSMRDHFTGMRGRFFTSSEDQGEVISRASGVIQDLFKDSNVATYLEGYLEEGRAQDTWLIS